MIEPVEKAIKISDLGLNPNNDGRLDSPQFATAQRRTPQGIGQTSPRHASKKQSGTSETSVAKRLMTSSNSKAKR
jgi:hypothetical protein